ncbi:DUF4296 domain-containing protein [Wenyingzhuangia sp. IMCC45533]
MNKLFYKFSIVIILAVVGCNSNTIIKKPENLIPKEMMIDVLTDTYLSTSAKNSVNVNGEKRVNYHALIYKKYNIDSLSFNESLKYYSSDIGLNEEILKQVKIKVEEQLNAKSKELKAKQTP